MSWECFRIKDSDWGKRYIKEIWNPSKARLWVRRELDRRSNVRSRKRQTELRIRAQRVNAYLALEGWCKCRLCKKEAKKVVQQRQGVAGNEELK